jgi:integrase
LALKAATIGQRQITAYIAKRKRDGAKNATINRDLEILRRAFRLGFEGDLVTKPLKIQKLVEDNVREGLLSHEQYIILRDGLPEPYQTLFVCGYHLGTRLGELSKLEWVEVNFDRNEITLKRYTTKTKEPRVLPIYGQMREFLLLAKQRRDQEQPACPWVFNAKDSQCTFVMKPGTNLLRSLLCLRSTSTTSDVPRRQT